jgi:hypothetical protein
MDNRVRQSEYFLVAERMTLGPPGPGQGGHRSATKLDETFCI